MFPQCKDIVAALEADPGLLSSWRVGVYGGVALPRSGVLEPLLVTIVPVDSPQARAAMPLALLAGFA